MVLTNKCYVHKKVRNRSKLRQAFCHLFPSFYLFAFCQKSDKKNKTVIFPVVLYGCEAGFLTIWGEQCEGVWEQGAEGNFWTWTDIGDRRGGRAEIAQWEDWGLYCSSDIVSDDQIRKVYMHGACNKTIWILVRWLEGTHETQIDDTELDLNGIDCRMFTGFNWLRIGSGNDLFWSYSWTFRKPIRQEIYLTNSVTVRFQVLRSSQVSG